MFEPSRMTCSARQRRAFRVPPGLRNARLRGAAAVAARLRGPADGDENETLDARYSARGARWAEETMLRRDAPCGLMSWRGLAARPRPAALVARCIVDRPREVHARSIWWFGILPAESVMARGIAALGRALMLGRGIWGRVPWGRGETPAAGESRPSHELPRCAALRLRLHENR